MKSVISPRMAASVIAATSALRPAAAAISSMHSIEISVESMSKAASLKSRSASGGVKPCRTSGEGEAGEVDEEVMRTVRAGEAGS